MPPTSSRWLVFHPHKLSTIWAGDPFNVVVTGCCNGRSNTAVVFSRRFVSAQSAINGIRNILYVLYACGSTGMGVLLAARLFLTTLRDYFLVVTSLYLSCMYFWCCVVLRRCFGGSVILLRIFTNGATFDLLRSWPVLLVVVDRSDSGVFTGAGLLGVVIAVLFSYVGFFMTPSVFIVWFTCFILFFIGCLFFNGLVILPLLFMGIYVGIMAILLIASF